MTIPAKALASSTRSVPAALAEVVRKLKPGQRIRVTQSIRVGKRSWTTNDFGRPVVGVFRELRYLQTGLSTDRVAEDDVIVPTVHFTKDNGELSSVALDEHTRIEIVEG